MPTKVRGTSISRDLPRPLFIDVSDSWLLRKYVYFRYISTRYACMRRASHWYKTGVLDSCMLMGRTLFLLREEQSRVLWPTVFWRCWLHLF